MGNARDFDTRKIRRLWRPDSVSRAMNRQPITFSYNPGDDTAAAHIDQSAGDAHHAFNDMGIAKLHFQIGAGQGQWAWGDGGLFIHK